MSRIALGAAALIVATWTASVEAADLYYGSQPQWTVNPPTEYDWARPYLGGNLGWAWGSVDNNVTSPSGFVGGAQAGYNFQTRSSPWVFGIEGDIQATGASDTFAPWKFSNPWFGTVRGRAGLGVQQHPGLRHGGTGLRRIARRDVRPLGDPHQCRLDRGRWRRIRFRSKLDHQA